jgi:hypothetical protein
MTSAAHHEKEHGSGGELRLCKTVEMVLASTETAQHIKEYKYKGYDAAECASSCSFASKLFICLYVSRMPLCLTHASMFHAVCKQLFSTTGAGYGHIKSTFVRGTHEL